MKELRAIILAAGKGTRMKSDMPKVLHPVCGRPMLAYVIEAVRSVGSLISYVVVGHEAEKVKKFLGPDIKTVVQKDLLGTADAVRCAEGELKDFKGDVLVLCGDTPLLRAETLKALIKTHRQTGASCTVLTTVVSNPSGYGRIIRGADGQAVAIREDKDLLKSERSIREINVGVYCFKSESLSKTLPLIEMNSKKKEFYLTDIVEVMAARTLKIETLETETPQEGWGINTQIDLANAAAVLRRRILEEFMLDGISIEDPATTFISDGVKIGSGTVVKPFTVIEGDVVIGKNCVIGPFAHFRPGTRIGNQVEIGNFTEISRSKIGDKSFMKHFSFLGDAVAGCEVNIGAGVVTANYDGKDKHQTRLGDGAFIGSDSILVAPVKIGKRAVTGAGCVVAKDKTVPDDHVMVGVPGKVIGKRKTQ